MEAVSFMLLSVSDESLVFFSRMPVSALSHVMEAWISPGVALAISLDSS